MPTKSTAALGLALAGLIAAAGGCAAYRSLGADQHTVYTTRDLAWTDGPNSLPAGARYAVLEGNPEKSGLFTMRLSLPDGYEIPPHWHTSETRITVLSGNLHHGEGETFQRGATRVLPAGSYIVTPARTRHFAHTRGETILQITSDGPWKVRYVNKADDPRAGL